MDLPTITTPRVLLRPWEAGDLAPYAKVCADREVMKFIADGAPMSLEMTRLEIEKTNASWRKWHYGAFAVECRTSGAFLGSVGFARHDFFPGVSPCVEIGWRLTRRAWGKGVATEAARAALDWGQNHRRLAKVFCFCQADNRASRRIAAKIGCEQVDRVVAPNYQRDVIVYRTVAGKP